MSEESLTTLAEALLSKDQERHTGKWHATWNGQVVHFRKHSDNDGCSTLFPTKESLHKALRSLIHRKLVSTYNKEPMLFSEKMTWYKEDSNGPLYDRIMLTLVRKGI